jgi:hypothetical protein
LVADSLVFGNLSYCTVAGEVAPQVFFRPVSCQFGQDAGEARISYQFHLIVEKRREGKMVVSVSVQISPELNPRVAFHTDQADAPIRIPDSYSFYSFQYRGGDVSWRILLPKRFPSESVSPLLSLFSFRGAGSPNARQIMPKHCRASNEKK